MRCGYCDMTAENLLATCQTCQEHFCNHQDKPTSLSHILQHLKDTKHTSYNFPYKGIPQCKECGRKNIVALFKDIDDSVLCSNHKNDDCVEFINEKRILFLLPQPTDDIYQQYENLNNLNELGIAEAKIRKAEQQMICDSSDQMVQLENLNQRLVKIPNIFPQKANVAKTILNIPYLESQFTSEIKNGQIIVQDNKLMTSDALLQEKINEAASQSLDYRFFMQQALKAEFLAKDIELEQTKEVLGSTQVMFRTSNNITYQAFFPWDRYKRLCNKNLRVGDDVCLQVQTLSGSIHNIGGIVHQIDQYAILQLNQVPPRCCLEITLHEANIIQLDKIKLSEVSSNIHNNLYNNHDVFRSEETVIYTLKFREKDFLMEEMIKSTKFITKSNEPNMLVLKGINVQENLQLASTQIPNKGKVDEIVESVIQSLSEVQLYEPNEKQKHAIKQSLTNSITLIQGCPGGGKTYTSTLIIQCLLKLYQDQKVLCCAGSNIAADNLTLYCTKLKLKVVRVVARSKEDIDISSTPYQVQGVSLHNIIRNKIRSQFYVQNNIISQQTNDALNEFCILNIPIRLNTVQAENFDAYIILEKLELENADVIVCTCASAAFPRVNSFQFSSLILDESSQVLEVESILPITVVPQHFILVGDQKQLGPTIQNKCVSMANFGRSLYSRLLSLGIKPIQLSSQYRMHPGLLEFPNQAFYLGEIKSEVDVLADERKLISTNKSGIQKKFSHNFPSFFWHILSQEEMEEQTKSFSNKKEADAVITLVKTLMSEYKLKQQQIGIITPYSAQQMLLQSQLVQYPQIEINSVDGFQGREKEIIIFSAVRSNDNDTIGFLHQKNRVNVAFTRAKNMFLIIGNAKHLGKKDTIWGDIVQFYIQKEALFQGNSINALEKFE